MGIRSRNVAAAVLYLMAVEAARAGDIIDQRGRTVSLSKPAQRIVFIPMPAPATFISIDGSDRKIVGMNSYSAIAMRDGILGKLFPGYCNISTDILMGNPSSFSPNVESILALRPDAVFQWATSGKDVISVLDRTGLPVLGMRLGTQDDFAGSVLMMGRVAGKEDRAKTLLDRQDAVMRRIEAEMKDLSPTEQPRVLYLGHAIDTFRVAGKGSYNDFYIRLTGGKNVAGDALSEQPVSIEQIMAWNPQVVLLGNFDTTMPEDIYKDARWQNIDAVKMRRVYRVPLGGYRWDPPSQESALTWIWLAELLHPHRDGTNLRAEMRDWFDFLYHHQLQDEEIDRILFADQNRHSAGYERFLVR